MKYLPKQVLVLGLIAGLCSWSAAQHQPGKPTAAEQVKLWQLNQELLKTLVQDSLRLSQAETTLSLATECHQASKTLANALEKSQTATQSAELGEHLKAILQDALAPTLAEARQQIAPGSRDYPRLKELHEQTRQSLKELLKKLPAKSAIRDQVEQLGNTLPVLE